MKMKKIILILSVIFFPVTIIFSPIIMMLIDIRRKQLIIVSLSEQILLKLVDPQKADVRANNSNLVHISDALEQLVITQRVLDQKRR